MPIIYTGTGIETVETVTYILRSWMKFHGLMPPHLPPFVLLPLYSNPRSSRLSLQTNVDPLQATDCGMMDIAVEGSNEDHKQK